ncbi:MAG: FAD-linked oxidase C-terminal domain-containing protein [Nocardioides sp.]
MVEAGDLSVSLRAAGVSDVVIDGAGRTAYASDASLYRVPPLAVVRPRHREEVLATLDVCRRLGVPMTARGGGTSVAGNAVGPGVVLDASRHLRRVLAVDPDARTAQVEPGVVPATLDRATLPWGLVFGPDPSTRSRCTLGGMIGNNACGARSLAFGRTADNVESLEVATGGGEVLSLVTGLTGTPTRSGDDPLFDRLEAVVAGRLAPIRTEFGRFRRQVSGYSLEHLLPERGFDVGRFLVGSEGTLAVTLEATVRLVPVAAERVTVVLGFDSIAEAGDAAPQVALHAARACEGLDARIVDVVRDRLGAVPELPVGRAWLFVELGADEGLEAPLDRARRLVTDIACTDACVVEDESTAVALWRIREDGAGLSGRSPRERPAWPGWEDAAVPPESLGDYLRAFDELLEGHDLTTMPYGHFAEGCVHARIDFPLDRAGGSARLRPFLEDAADLVARFGGTLSGEHGDGRARSELLGRMYSEEALACFAAVKEVFDPDHLLNPGVVVDPDRVDVNLRTFRVPRPGRRSTFALHADGGDLARALHRCTGVGKCRVEQASADTVMCPSYLATREEQHTTRGRARVLQDVVEGRLPGGFRAPEVADALELCLACRGCAVDCPTGVDMATYKAEALHQRYRHRVRPRSHYTLGRLPRWARLASRVPGVANRLLAFPGLGGMLRRSAGVDPRRRLPPFAQETFQDWWRRAGRAELGDSADRRPITVFVDTFSDLFTPHVAQATFRVLWAAGYAPRPSTPGQCCGLTWISTGQLDSARRRLRRTVASLDPRTPSAPELIVGVEPSCTAVLRSDAVELLAGDPGAEAVAVATRTLAELLSQTAGWTPPDLIGRTLVAQPHCHHHAVMGWSSDAELLRAAGAEVTRVGGCCGLAGNFGVETGRFEISRRIAEQQLLPAVESAPGATVLADGFSCRTQLAELAGRSAVHLAELLVDGSGVPQNAE